MQSNHMKSLRIVSLPGDGIGPEVNEAALSVAYAVMREAGFRLDVSEHRIGGVAIDVDGTPLPEDTRTACSTADAVLLGAVGGAKWDDAPVRPERGLLALRKMLGVYANLRPVSVAASQVTSSPLRPSVVAQTDMLIVRELTGGIYFGEPAGRVDDGGRRIAVNTMRYSDDEIARVAHVAFRSARSRSGRVTSVDKANVLAVSQLWREVVTEVHQAHYPDVELDHLYVDNAAMQLVRRPSDFDVIVTSNLFGDILSDLAATLPGSLGMLPSASLGEGPGLFEPVHGSAPDIAGQCIANPCAAILSIAMLLEDVGFEQQARSVRTGVRAALDAGVRTVDLGGRASTEEMTQAVIANAVSERTEVAA
jgi:3-isopropylmalate dehydrogenase